MSEDPPVLVAEDTQLLAALLKDALAAHQVARRVMVFSTGPDFLDAYTQLLNDGKPVRLLVLDIMMPGLDGLDTGRMIRNLERHHKADPAPLVFFSSREEDDEIRAAVADCFPARFVRKRDSKSPALVALEGARLLRDIVSGQPS